MYGSDHEQNNLPMVESVGAGLPRTPPIYRPVPSIDDPSMFLTWPHERRVKGLPELLTHNTLQVQARMEKTSLM